MKVFKADLDSGLKCNCGETEEHLLIVDKKKNKSECRKCTKDKKIFETVPEENF